MGGLHGRGTWVTAEKLMHRKQQRVLVEVACSGAAEMPIPTGACVVAAGSPFSLP